MGVTDFGTQTLTIDYNEAGKTDKVNVLNYQISQKGIYIGGLLTKTGVNELTLSALIAQTEDKDYLNGIGVRVETSTTVVINGASSPYVLSATNCYIVARMSWVATASNYMDILAVGYNAVPSSHVDPTIFWDTDIIIGKAVYIGGVLQSSVDYTLRHEPSIIYAEEKKQAFKVIPTAVVSKQVEVASGSAFLNGELVAFAGATSDVFTDTTGARTDLLCLDKTGNLVNIEGINGAGVPDIPTDIIVLALINRITGRDSVTGIEITSFDYEKSGSTNLPIGTFLMYDGTDWVDNVTMRGWYACIPANAGQGCPDMIDSFVMGRDPSIGASNGGANTLILTETQMPPHHHSISHTHANPVITGGNHAHYNYVQDFGSGSGWCLERENNDNAGWNIATQTDGGHSHGASLPSYSGNSTIVGGGSSFDNKPKFYTIIYIRKCN